MWLCDDNFRFLNDESKTKKALVEVTKNINGDQGYVITAERGTKKAEIKTALKKRSCK